MRGRWRKVCLAALLSAAMLSCGYAQVAADDLAPGASEFVVLKAAAARPDPGTIARDIAKGIGTVRQVVSEGKKGPVFIFEEYHTSRVGQLQIGVMLLRLHDRHKMRVIGLEGAFQSRRPLDAKWFRAMGGAEAQQAREDVALRMLSEGEINAAEFMTLVFRDAFVYGLEKAEQYDVKLDVEGNPQAVVLLDIAQQKLTPADVKRLTELINEGKKEEAFKYLMTADPWVREQFEAMKNPMTSLEDIVKRIGEIRQKAKELGVTIEAEAEKQLDREVRFFQVAAQRSNTMSLRQVQLVDMVSGAPTAMLVGAAHSRHVTAALRQRGVSFALIRPIAFNPEYATLSMDQFELKNRRMWTRTGEGTLGRLLNTERKPRPIIDTTTGKSYASALFAAKIISEAARGRKRVPDDISDQLRGLEELEIDFDSFSRDGFDVIYSMWVTDTSNRKKKVWARVGTTDSDDMAKTLEEKMLEEIRELRGEKSPRKPPANSSPTKDKEGPGDGKRDDVVISRIRRSLAVFADRQSKAVEVGRISG